MKRSYDQFCALARALDLVGERWTLLLVRELLLGPRRYSDLLDGLPGIGTNLLAKRLQDLEAAGLVLRVTLPPPASRAYELTKRGRELEPALVALARFGMSPMEPPRPGEERRPSWYALALLASFRPDAAADLDEDYAFRVGGQPFHLRLRRGTAEARDGEPAEPAFTLEAGLDEFLAVATGSLPLEALGEDGDTTSLRGDRAAARRWLAAFRLPEPDAREGVLTSA